MKYDHDHSRCERANAICGRLDDENQKERSRGIVDRVSLSDPDLFANN